MLDKPEPAECSKEAIVLKVVVKNILVEMHLKPGIELDMSGDVLGFYGATLCRYGETDVYKRTFDRTIPHGPNSGCKTVSPTYIDHYLIHSTSTSSFLVKMNNSNITSVTLVPKKGFGIDPEKLALSPSLFKQAIDIASLDYDTWDQ